MPLSQNDFAGYLSLGWNRETGSDSHLNALSVAIKNGHSGAVLKLLAKGATFNKTYGHSSLLETAARLGPRCVIENMSKHQSLEITETVMLAAIAGNILKDTGVVEFLLLNFPHNAINAAMIILSLATNNEYCHHQRVLAAAAAGNYCDDGKILRFLLATCPDLVITDNVILVALNDQLRYLKAFELLSTHLDIVITEELLNAVARNRHQALKILISRHLHFKTTETVAVKMADANQRLEVLEILLSTSPDFQITEAIVLVLLQPSSISVKALEFLFSNFRDVQITKAVVNETMVVAVLKHRENLESLKHLLSRVPNLLITEAMIVAAAGFWSFETGSLALELLLSRCPDFLITEAAVVAAASCYYSVAPLRFLLSKYPEFQMTENVVTTERVLVAAAGSSNKQTLRSLLLEYPDLEITGNIVAAACGGTGETLEFLLLDFPFIQLPEAAALAAANSRVAYHSNHKAISLVLNRKPHIEITQAFLAAAEKNLWSSGHI
ncbi:hypothetical protein DFP73DRAFT_593287 [Morchella snyderi]|nr:hypothetical protein DFP73DRAFT_593287 [Morchella snyderi]